MNSQKQNISSQAINIIDNLDEVISLVDCIFLSAHGLQGWECGAIQSVCNVSKDRLFKAKAIITQIQEREKLL